MAGPPWTARWAGTEWHLLPPTARLPSPPLAQRGRPGGGAGVSELGRPTTLPSPSARLFPLTGVLQAGRNIPRVKAPRRGPLRTPMTVKEPWKIGWGVAKGRATLVLRASVYLLGKQDLRNPTASLETPLCLSVSKGEGTLCLSPLGLRQRCPSSLLMDVIPPPYQGEALPATGCCPPTPHLPHAVTSNQVVAGSMQGHRWQAEPTSATKCMTLSNLSARRTMPHLLGRSGLCPGGGSPGGRRPPAARTEPPR